MKCKYKKFLKAAYIDYGEDYCGHGSGTFTKPAVTTPIIVITGTTATIACAISGVTIYYTLDGSTPTSNSTEYTGTITLTLSCTIKAIAVKLGLTDSAVASESYIKPITYLTQWKIVGNSEVHTLPYTDIPQGYTKCKYLEFHGTEYFNTGIKTNNGIGMSLTFSTTTESKTIIGARMSASSNVFVFGMFASGKFVTGYGSYGQQIDAHVNALDGQQHTFTLSNTQCKFDNINIDINFGTFSTPNANDIYIGTWNTNGTPDDRVYEGKIYSVRLYDSNGNLFNGIPCLDDNNVPCLYDTVSGTAFYNDGTGTFGYEVYPQPTEIWSCGEYNPIDGKWHILVQSEGGSIADIALTEPLRKVNDVADTIEFPSSTDGKALVTRVLKSIKGITGWAFSNGTKRYFKYIGDIKITPDADTIANILCPIYQTATPSQTISHVDKTISIASTGGDNIVIYDADFVFEGGTGDTTAFNNFIKDYEIVYELKTPATELVDAPQIAEAESYSMVISQGGKAVSWSSFETE